MIFISKLTYIVNFFEKIKTLNFSLQGNMTNILTAQENVLSFLCKLKLYKRRSEVEDILMFPELTMGFVKRNEKCLFTNQKNLHLLLEVDSIGNYFPCLNNRQVNAWFL